MQTFARIFVRSYTNLKSKSIQMTKIKQAVLDRMSDNVRVKALISYELNKHNATVERFIKNNHEALTAAPVLKVICDELGLTKEEVLEVA